MEQRAAANLSQNEDFLQKTYQAAMIPSILSILSGCINIIADGILVGHKIGTGGLAAINLCVPIYLVLCIAGSFFVSGAAISSSKEIGANRTDKAMRYYRAGITVCLIVSALITIIGILFAGEVAAFLCQDKSIFPMVREYTFVTLAGALPKILLYVPFWYLRLDGKNKSVVVMMTIMAAGNVVLDILFLYGAQMGVLGAALASVISTAAACVYGFVSLNRGNFHFLPGPVLPDKEELQAISKAGSPAAMNNLLQTLRLLCVNSLLLKYGGSMRVAEFSVINGISAFAEAVTVGVPQAGTAMLSIYHGEHDNESTGILLKLEVKRGVLLCLVFGAAIVLGSDLIAEAYGLETSMFLPMLCLAVSLIPSLWNNILSNYYSVSDHIWLSNLIIVLKVFVFTVVGLLLMLRAGATPWLFLVLGESFTTAVWFLTAEVLHRRKKMKSRFFLMDQNLKESGQAINFSVVSDAKKICEAGEKITSFCEDNGMSAKQIFRVSLTLEEMMTLIMKVNKTQQIQFDIRIFAIQEVIGIRIRYNGKMFNPLAAENDFKNDDELYMGMGMLQKMVEQVTYQNTFGMNTLLILV